MRKIITAFLVVSLLGVSVISFYGLITSDFIIPVTGNSHIPLNINTIPPTQCSDIGAPNKSSFVRPNPDPTRLTYILFDRSSSYKEYTQSAIELFLQALPEVLSPSDYVIAAWVGANSDHPDAVFFRGKVSDLSPPSFPSTPFPPDYLPFQNLEGTTMDRIRLQEENKLREIENARMESEFLCEMHSWKRETELIIEKWEMDKHQIVQEFLDNAKPYFIADFENFDGRTDIWSALGIASRILQGEIRDDQFDEYVILIFSDMLQTGVDKPTPSLNLSGIDRIVIAMCAPVPKCENMESTWKERLANAQAGTIDFLFVQETTKERLIRLLRRIQ